MSILTWWFKIVAIGVCSLFFLWFGLCQLISAYSMDHPQMFVLVFFSASLVIMVSMVGILYPLLQIRAFLKSRRTGHLNGSS